MKNIIIGFFLLVFSFSYSQNNEKIFPDDFLGIYKGELSITTENGKQKIPMEFHLLATDSIHKFDYKLVYNKAPRNYTLVVKNKEKGLFEIDENNGIILPTFFNENVLHSFFEVQGNFLSTRLDFTSENSLAFEILFSRLQNKTKTGGISKEIPEVFGYPITVFQKAILKKQ
ncbi:MAG: hypothetical protein MK202_13635 [Tenacibaculum sp.]|nr:hypothetical protein [Tenacibaculum sp.]